MTTLDNIKQFRDIHSGKRLFILASGPSLNSLDLSILKNKLVMGLNRSFLIYPDTHYHCCMDQRLFELYPNELQRARYLFTLRGRSWGIPITLLGGEGFSSDLAHGIYSGYTISYIALQIALYMGFSDIVYLGLDLQHQEKNTHFFEHDFHSRNHEDTEFPKMRRMLSYGAGIAKQLGKRVINCSSVSNIENFIKLPYQEVVSL